MKLTTVMGAVAIALAPGAHAAGVDQTQPHNPDFLKLDVNKDGYVTRAEAQKNPAIAKNFSRCDTAKRGKLDEGQFDTCQSMIEREKAGEYVDDSTITTKVKSKLVATKGISSFDIGVKTTNGTVLLTGEVATGAQVKQAGQIARGTKGVKSVDNRLTVKAKK